MVTIFCWFPTFVFTHLFSHRLCVIDCFRGTGCWWKRQRNTKQEFNLRSLTASLLRPSGDGNDDGCEKCWQIQVRPLNDQLHVHAGLPEETKESGGSSGCTFVKRIIAIRPNQKYNLWYWKTKYFFLQDKTVTWFWRLREIFDGQKTKGDRLPLENMLEGLISQVWPGQWCEYSLLVFYSRCLKHVTPTSQQK